MSGEARFEIYPQVTPARDQAEGEQLVEVTGEFGWRFKSANGQISGIGGEGFTRREDAVRAIHDFLDAVDPEGAGTDRTHAPIIDVDLDGTPEPADAPESPEQA